MAGDDEVLVTSFIDPPLWDRAGWLGVAWGNVPDSQLPLCILLFKNKEPAETIFKGWQKRLTTNDRFNELRLSVIEGRNNAGVSGYWFHITSELSKVPRRFGEDGKYQDPAAFVSISRVHWMEQAAGTSNLDRYFRPVYARTKAFRLVPAIMKGREVGILAPLSIEKTVIHLRKKEDIKPPSDIDIVALRLHP
jgi:hypothetical protein